MKKNYLILFATLFVICAYALYVFDTKSYPEAAIVMAKSGIAVSILGILFTSLCKFGSNGMSIEE